MVASRPNKDNVIRPLLAAEFFWLRFTANLQTQTPTGYTLYHAHRKKFHAA